MYQCVSCVSQWMVIYLPVSPVADHDRKQFGPAPSRSLLDGVFCIYISPHSVILTLSFGLRDQQQLSQDETYGPAGAVLTYCSAPLAYFLSS
jgi:hypothetical protein